MAGPLHPGTLAAIAGDRAIDDPGVDRLDRRIIEPEPLDHPRAKILQHDVGLAEERLQRRDVRRILEVEREALLGTVDGVKQRRIAADLGVAEIQPPRQVAPVRSLDLDHPCAKVLQPERRIGSAQELAHVDDDQAR